MKIYRVLLVSLLAILFAAASASDVGAKKGGETKIKVCDQVGCSIRSTGSKTVGRSGSQATRVSGSQNAIKTRHYSKASDPEEEARRQRAAARAREVRIKAQIATYQAALAKQQACMATTKMPVTKGSAASFCTPPTMPNLGKPGFVVGVSTNPTKANPAKPQITLTPQQIAYMAFARLRLTPPTPGIGPSPDLNRWKMAAVGYPLWLWAAGDTDPAAVSDSVFNLFVSLDAHVTRLDFDMGDGQTVTCQGVGTKWTAGVKPDQASPTCGYAYQRPSRPGGDYTVTVRTHWAVDWNMNGTTGTIPYVQSSTATLPVGELQVLVR